MNKLAMCMICSDKKHFESKLSESKRILNNLNRIVMKYPELKNIKSYKCDFYVERQNVHFMCGNCTNVSTMQLKNVENEIYNDITNIVFLLDNKKLSNTDYYNILRLLAGHYPRTYRNLEKIYYKNKL